MYLLAETFAHHLFFNLDKNMNKNVDIDINENENIEKEVNSNITSNENEKKDDDEHGNKITGDNYSHVMDSDCITESSDYSDKSSQNSNIKNEKNMNLTPQIVHSNNSHKLIEINENSSLSSANNLEGIYNKWDMLGSKSQRRLFRQLFVVSLVLWLAWLASTSIQQTSRRLANIAFVSLILSLSFTLILLIAIVDSIGDLVVVNRGKKRKNASIGATVPLGSTGVPPVPVPVRTLEYLNSMQLPVFLIANVLTGIVNMSMKTIYVTHVHSLMVLFFYSLIVTGISWILTQMKKM